MNWNQTGMPTALVSQLGRKRELAEFRSVLGDAQNRIMRPVDVELMAQELQKSGGREFVEMVKELTTALENAKRELEDANQRCERLAADLRRRGVDSEEAAQVRHAEVRPPEEPAADLTPEKAESSEDGLAEWEEWNRRFQALLG